MPTGPTSPAAVSLLPAAPSSLVAGIRDRLDLFGEAAAGGRPFDPMLGPDLFGLGRPPEAPEGLSEIDYDLLSVAQGMTLLRRLDLTRPFPDEDTLTPESLADGRADVLTSEWTDSDRKHWEHEELDWDTLPARRETPKLLHGIWLGGPLADAGTTGIFQQGFAESARTLAGQAVLWTDVPRRRFEAALANESDASYAGERQMARWARSNGINLVNVDEVFNAEAPMRLDSFYRAELTKGTRRGYAAASDTLRVQALARFGGLYLDGDDRLLTPDILLRVHESPLGFGVSGVSGAAWSVPETMWNNNGLAWAKGHPMGWVYLDVLERSYRLPQAEVFPDVLAKAEKESFVTRFGRPRRHSVLWRTGPQLFPKLRDRTGEFAPLTGITHNSLSSWVPGRGHEAEPPRVTAADPDGTALLTAKVIQTLVRELANRQGDLHLTEVADLVERHETPAAIWSAALGYFADTPLLRERVRTMTSDRYQHDGFTTVSLPAEAAALLLPREGRHVEFLGETVVPITMRASSGRTGGPNEIDWPSPPPPRDLAETVLAKRAIPRSETTSVRETPAPDTPELVLDDPLAGRAPDAGQANKLTELVRYLAEQSVLRTRRGFPQPSVELRVAGDTSGAELIQRQLIDQTHRLRDDASAPDPTVQVRQVPEVAAGKVELRVDWELRGSGSSTPAPISTSPVAKPLTITTDLPPARHPILDDHGWRHSTAATADWMTDPAPLTRAELDAARDRVEPVIVRAEDTGPQVLELLPGRPTEQWWQPIAYDYRRFEARPGKWVQEYTVRLDFVSAPGFGLARYLDRAQGALDRVYNHRYRLPTGDAFHLRVEHDPSGRAHGTVTVTTPGTSADQLHWPADIDDLTLAHEFGHFTGLHDEYVRLHGKDKTTAWALRGPKSSRVVSDDGLYTRYLADYLNAPSGRAALPVPSVKPRNLWLVEHRARTLGATAGISTGSPATTDGTAPAVSRSTSEPDPVARLSALAAQANRHLAALPESIAQGLRARLEDQHAELARITTAGLSPRDLAGLAARIADLEQAVTELREARLRQLITLHEAAVSAGTRGENPLRFYPEGVPGGVTSRPDARFGLEFEFQLRGADFGGQIGALGRLLETNGIVEWNGGAWFDDTDTDPTRWTLVEEPDLDAGAELRSPILRGVPESWRETERALRVIGSHRNSDGGEPDAGGVGGHVNVSFDRRPDLAVYGRLAQLTKVFEDVLYRLGNHSGPDAPHRRLQPVGPNALPLALSDITSADDVRALNTTKDEAVSFRNVDDEPGDRVEFRFWAGGLSEAEWQARAEVSGALRLAAEDPALDGRLRELLTKPRLVGHTPAFPGREAELAYLLDFLELLPLSRAAEELAVVLHARTRTLSVTAGNDPRLVAQSVVGPGGRGWSFPVRGTGIPEALHTTASLPRYPGAEIVAATLTAGQDAVDLWTADPVPLDAFGEVLQARNPTFGVPGSELPPGGSPRLVLAVPGGAAKLGPVVSNAIDEPVVATDGRLWFTADDRLETDSEWVELVSGSVRLRSGHSDLGMALALMTAMDPDHSESPAGVPSEQLPLGPALPEAPDLSFLPEIVPDPQSFTQQVVTTFDDLWRTGERIEAIESAPPGVPPLSLSFPETATTVIADGFAALRPTARAIAQAAVTRAERKTPGLEVTVTTYSERPGAASLQRAAQVRALLRAALAEELATRSDGPVRLEDIEIHAEIANNPDGVTPDGHHHVVVETSVAVTRSAAEDSAFKAYDSVTHSLASLRLPKAEVEGRLAEFSELASGGRLEHHPLPDSARGQLIVLNETLAAFGDAEVVDRVRALVNEAVLAASLVPVREQMLQPQQGRRGLPVDRRTIQPVTPARLTQLLDELTTHLARGQDPTRAPTSAATGMTITPGDHLAVRLASLGLVNLSASSRAAVAGDPLYRHLLRNPAALVEALFAGTGHEEQRFLNTCAPAAIDTGVRGRVPTIAGLLSVGRAVADATDRDLLRVDPVARSKRDRAFGRTLEAMVRKRVSDARAEFSAIEEAAFALVSANQADPSAKQAWNALSDRWGRTMQKLSAADLQAVSVPVLTRKVIPGDWLTSLILTSPLVVDRGARRLTGVTRSSYVARLQPHLAFEPDGTMFGANELIRDPEQEVRLGEELTSPDALAAFWMEVRARGGTVVLTPGHCVQLGAAISDGEPVFVLGDGKYANSLQQTPEQFARWAKSWDARTHSKLFPTLDDESKSGSSGSLHTRVSRS
ncbi:hypothetical protein [Amycolatopsis oliviviridis]|uniref:hypothetical protein n=1 Tax=Amycolatopsis oliviviridis TaxID=1471590 RepID=UPI00174BF964|nr:hypothetical protein [Amycolatopsis oliviviridis]